MRSTKEHWIAAAGGALMLAALGAFAWLCAVLAGTGSAMDVLPWYWAIVIFLLLVAVALLIAWLLVLGYSIVQGSP